jgi:hypothetical protein
LLKATTIPAGETLGGRGPKMLLAQALLDRGERDIVVEYLERMKTAWKSPAADRLLQKWIDNIRRGKANRLNLIDLPMFSSPADTYRWLDQK